MLKGKIVNYLKYSELPENILKGLRFLHDTDFNKLNDGRHVLSDTDYVNLQTYKTKIDADFEAHRDYIDIQYMISGKEYIGVCDYSVCQPKISYSKEKDIEFLSGTGINHQLSEGEFMILYPEDVHKPSIMIDSESIVRKAVVKIKI